MLAQPARKALPLRREAKRFVLSAKRESAHKRWGRTALVAPVAALALAPCFEKAPVRS
jgi:hypothetical protein